MKKVAVVLLLMGMALAAQAAEEVSVGSTGEAVAVESTGEVPSIGSTEAGPVGGASLEHIQKLLTVTHRDNMGADFIRQITASAKAALPQVPESFWAEFDAKADMAALNKQVAQIYAKYLSDEDVMALLDFYRTPIGMKIADIQPKLDTEIFQAAQMWGREIARSLRLELMQKGYMPGRPSGPMGTPPGAPGVPSGQPAPSTQPAPETAPAPSTPSAPSAPETPAQ